MEVKQHRSTLYMSKEATHKRPSIGRFHSWETSRIGKSFCLEGRLVVPGAGEEGTDWLVGIGSPSWVMRRFWNQTVIMVAQCCELT
jgi:hypothetical protein